MGKKNENTHFVCAICAQNVSPLVNGSYRNHCPFCLGSIHVDNIPGDRKSQCRGVMLALGLTNHTKKGWQVIHKCQKCGIEKVNKIADNDPQSDNWQILINLSTNER